MRSLIILATTLSVVIPAAADAQRGGMGGARGGAAGRSGMGASASVTRRDIDRMDPVKALLDEKKALQLDKAQETQLESIRAAIKPEVDSLFRRLDSAQKNMPRQAAGVVMPGARGGGGGATTMTPAEQERAAAARTVMGNMLALLGQTYRTAGEQALAVLTEEQRITATAVLEKHARDQRGTGRGGDRSGALAFAIRATSVAAVGLRIGR
jgi:hypothetical protein